MMGMKNNSGFYELQLWIAAFLLFFCANPYFLWQGPYVSVALAIFCIVSLNHYSFKKGNIFQGFLFVLIYLIYVFKANLTVFGGLSLLLISFFFFMSRYYLEDVYNKFIVVFALLLIPSILQYILCEFAGISFPYTIIQPYEEGKQELYRQYTFFVQYDHLAILPRFYSYFDEPGVVGTLCGMILLSKKFNLSSWPNVILMIAGVLSFSLAFFLFAFLALFLIQYKKKFFVISLLLIIVVALSQVEYFSPFFMRFTLEDGRFIGNNRTIESFDMWYSHFIRTPDAWFGMGRGYATNINEGGSSYKSLIVDYGILFTSLYICSFCFIAIKRLKLTREFIIWMTLFLGCIYQRPSINRPEFVLLWLVSIYYLSNRKEVASIFNNNGIRRFSERRCSHI